MVVARHYFIVALHYFNVALHYFNVALHYFNVALHYLIVALQLLQDLRRKCTAVGAVSSESSWLLDTFELNFTPLSFLVAFFSFFTFLLETLNAIQVEDTLLFLSIFVPLLLPFLDALELVLFSGYFA